MTVITIDAGRKQVSRSVDVQAPVGELFAIVANPRRHQELDGSGTVRDNVSGPERLSKGARFATKMTMFGVPYRVTSTVIALEPDQLIEWRHPLGHRWRWEFTAAGPTTTRVTETFDFRSTGPIRDRINWYELTGFAKRNATGIENTLRRLRDRYSK